MEKSTVKAIEQLIADYAEVNEKTYADYYIALLRLRTLVEYIGIGNYDDMFDHIYRAASIYIEHKPGREDDEQSIVGIKRELDYLIHQLPYPKKN